jgi:hypothetical protein
MAYARLQSVHKLNKMEKVEFLKEYVAHYEKAVKERGVESLNTKIPREVFASTLDTLGDFLQDHARQLLKENEDVQGFLRANPLPPHMAGLLPDEFKVFSLLLNALKQWVSSESAATDRYLLGGTARQTCREATHYCIITGEKLDDDAELHHPVRDGRPPILLSKKGHDIVERVFDSGSAGQGMTSENLTEKQNELLQKIQLLRSKQNQSWAQLREGCAALLNPNKPCRPNAKSFARAVIRKTESTLEEIMQLLNNIGK